MVLPNREKAHTHHVTFEEQDPLKTSVEKCGIQVIGNTDLAITLWAEDLINFLGIAVFNPVHHQVVHVNLVACNSETEVGRKQG